MEGKHIGSSFDNFLQEEGLMAEAETTALKRVLAYQIKQEMELQNISKTALAKMMKISRSSVDRLLDPKNSSVTLLTLENVAVALGKRLKLQFAYFRQSCFPQPSEQAGNI
ncbi:MAG: helix-turn-helix domain-containing protein [Desulfotignum sp.]|nr:helix-turn-helix domain-containing protein [Desulfotignum sp.]MCF8088045.1 helix-turn-helix domain-containing protein [Desulfotignum sp.]MCF8137793.1 helix-turn-helix domain-containing protein [Desulfotignum sp.]